MSGIAAIMFKQGYRVSGSDIKESLITAKLSSLGIKVCLGHDASYISDAELLVYSSAVKEDNPELQAAKAKGMKILKRAEALAQLMQDKVSIAISGAHGKTTTCALAGHLLLQAGFSPTVAIGGILRNIGDNSCVGESNFFLAEADESDGTFLYYHPHYSIVTNIDREHLDFYKNWQDILSAYKKFISHTKDGGCLFCCGDDPAIRLITPGYKKRMLSFGLSGENDFYPRNLLLNEFSSIFDCYYRDGFIGRMHLPLAGRHNISNSLAVIALGIELGIKPPRIEEALAVFKGTERRFQLKAKAKGIKLIDDYGHHPSELRVTLEAAKNVRHKRLIVVFQPHRFSRTKFLMHEFAESLSLADCIILTDIYAASEEPIDGVSSEVLCDKIKEKHPLAKVIYLKKEKVIERLLSIVSSGDLILTLGAGDIGKLSDELAQRIKG
ncbi:MAG: UDP-N-acetylmuramate--L-alanine ligase [Omnitrophica WOR_2 bacterium RIFCSPHIGHO2_02_FULL_45_21]|nr:MAG: UDP-N-acetylmuramate--L-alanine ligase [Omnitrophica WOR_2 bacterium RIFCSPHIGHO2_02_FULL_45_21]OGX42204.1 MAG: UDP-N-acetylmuramate--L-alanine ligase [Omnitrophica WOR_2 bacterium RIFCSPLOWO2_02_FULL_45_28]